MDIELRRSKNAAYMRMYRIKNHERVLKNASVERLTRRLAIIAKFGGHCIRCGFDDWRVLQVDHIKGGGSAERRSFGNNVNYQSYLLREADTSEYQLLCANCNQLKRYEDEEDKRRFQAKSSN